jgi:Bax protein
MKRVLNFLVWLCCALWAPVTQAEELWLKDMPTAKLEQLYKDINYTGEKGYLLLPDLQYPTVFLKNFPKDFASITNEKHRNALFIKILAPLALRINTEIVLERQQILDIQTQFNKEKTLSKKELQILEDKAQKYDLFSRLKGTERTDYLIKELLYRIDRVPPSILITAAIIHTNWGTSRIVTEANSLYKTLVWHTDQGLKPIGETEDDTYRIKIYPDIYTAMREYALYINSHIVFQSLRNFRYRRSLRNPVLSGNVLAPYVYGSSSIPNYAGLFDYTLAYYELFEIDKASLTDHATTPDLYKKYAKYVTKL